MVNTMSDKDFLIYAWEKLGADKNEKIHCPICGNEIILIENGSSDIVKCKTPDCLSTSFRGI
ncbi:hypothetical protein FACS189499_10050 [Clostridia bacterium]|nr:hypothetical protein FACS189499_10050 [Clostridia bacterium]